MNRENMKADDKLLTIIMPVHNEGDAIIPVVATLLFTVSYPFKLAIVYDSEEDETIITVKKLQQHFDDIYLIQNKWKKGALNALKTGFNYADTPYVGIWTSYHVDPYGILNEMMKEIEKGFDLVSANRFTPGTIRARGNRMKRLLSYWGNSVLNKVIGMPITDATTSLKVYRKSLLDAFEIETAGNGGWAACSELAIKAAIEGYRLTEVPLERKNVSLITGVTNFKVFNQFPEYFRWLYLGWRNRKLIRKHLDAQLEQDRLKT